MPNQYLYETQYMYLLNRRHIERAIPRVEEPRAANAVLLRAPRSLTNHSDQCAVRGWGLCERRGLPTRLQYNWPVAPCRTALTRANIVALQGTQARCVLACGKLLRLFRREQQLFQAFHWCLALLINILLCVQY